MPQLVVGVDSSTQSTKVEARNISTGEIVAVGSARHPDTTPPVSEQDPQAWWDALVDALAQLGDHRADVVAISVAGQQHGLALVDNAGESVRPAKLWNDTTSADRAQRLVDRLGADEWARRVGSVPVAAFTISKLAWIADNEPATLERTAMVMLPHDYLTWRLSGEHVTDRGDASGTGWFDPVANQNDIDLVELATGSHGVPDGWLPRVLGPTEAAGTLTPEAVAATGLPATAVVGPGTGDNMGAALGLGLRPGDVAISLGTSGTAFAVSSQPARDPSGLVAGFADANGVFLPLVCTLNATKVTDTTARWLGMDRDTFATAALASAGDPGTVTVLPYFDGERSPNLPHARGRLEGLTNETSAGQIALAAHDGVLAALIDGIGFLEAAGAATEGRRFLIGGGANSVAYRQRAADLVGDAITVPSTTEAVRGGAAVQAAAVCSGDSIDATMARWNLGDGLVVEPSHPVGDILERYRAAVDQAMGEA